MRLVLLFLLGGLVSSALVLLASPYLKWVREKLRLQLLSMWRRLYVAVGFFVALLPAELSGVNVFSASDNTPGIAYSLGLIMGVSTTLLVRRRLRRR
jgi:hypothetical protein